MSGLLSAINISAQGLSVQRAKMNAVADNIANAETTETAEGGPYRRKRVLVSEVKETRKFSQALRRADNRLTRTHAGHRSGGSRPTGGKVEMSFVKGQEVQDPSSSFKLVHDPSHPQADAEGYVKMPDVEIINEMVDMMAATRAYEANTVAISSAKQMARNALDI